MTNGQIAAFVAALCVLAVVLVLGYAPSLDDGEPPQLGPFVTGDGDAVQVEP